MQKVYWKPDLLKLEQEYKEADQLNAAEEWVKGLEDKGKEAMAEIMRWTRWEEGIPFGKRLFEHMRDCDLGTFKDNVHVQPRPIGHAHPATTGKLVNLVVLFISVLDQRIITLSRISLTYAEQVFSRCLIRSTSLRPGFDRRPQKISSSGTHEHRSREKRRLKKPLNNEKWRSTAVPWSSIHQ